MNIVDELNETLKFLVTGLHTIVNKYDGYAVISLAKRGKLSSIVVTNNEISYKDRSYNIKGGAVNKGVLAIQDIIISDFK